MVEFSIVFLWPQMAATRSDHLGLSISYLTSSHDPFAAVSFLSSLVESSNVILKGGLLLDIQLSPEQDLI